ncbi:hypothetical protein RLOC_00013020 [Lonchura striata]|uniref:Uncharacterized protein n=1 Tax=Lonchura striata TaxID=40157 RepID=A0A218V4F1_9PASE|nr:hypothetical protein RLOC_00013020 [Lonchura striata domestica]
MVHDKLTASKRQPVLQHGYRYMLCCPIFPTQWLLKTQIQHSSQEGYSWRGFYHGPEVLGEQEIKAQEAAAPGRLSTRQVMKVFAEKEQAVDPLEGPTDGFQP